jgi:NADH-quinone oxidoreductase subunit G
MPVEVTAAKVLIDGRAHQVDPGQSLLQACLSLGYDLPYFCWHPAMGSVGACRQCAVKQFKDEHDTRGKIVMACMTPAAPGARISIADAEAAEFRRGVIEGMMLNHPHDCPVCDEGGECHLQDMTVMTGHDYRRTRFPKRTYRNQDLGPLLNHEMNRCIQCYRCVRFYREYAGGRDFDAFSLRDLVYFGRAQDGVLESEFAGNLVEVCPTGVFTDATLKHHYTRKWDLQLAPSICVHCGLGCNVSAGERYGVLRRILNRYHGEVNGWFLCDRGRFGYEFVNGPRRVRAPLVRRGGHAGPASPADAAELLARLAVGGGAIGIGSPRASLESNFALRALVGADRFFAGVADAEGRLTGRALEILREGPARTPSLRDVERCDAVLVLGEDVSAVAPRMALALRQSVRQQPMQKAAALHIPLWLDQAVREVVQDEKGPLFLATPAATRLDDVAAATLRAAPDDLARLGFAVARALDASAPAVADLAPEVAALADRIASALAEAQRPLVVSGPSCGSAALIEAAANVARALHARGRPAALAFTAPESNTLGLALMAARPLGEAFEAVRGGAGATVVVLENDLYRRAPAPEVERFLGAVRHLVVLDHLATPTAERAELLLPAGTFAEADGTLVSSEGRAQRFFQVLDPADPVRPSWRWLCGALAAGPRRAASAWSLDDVLAALAEELPALAPARGAAPPASFRLAGQKIPRAPHRSSGRTALHAGVDVSEPKPPDDPDSALAFSMEGSPAQPPAALIPFFWSPGWNSIQATQKFQEEVNGPLRGGNPGVRLVEPPHSPRGAYFRGVPPAFAPRDGEWLLVPLHRIFGSEELSRDAPALAQLAAPAVLSLRPQDASSLGLAAGAVAEIRADAFALRLPVSLRPELPAGVAGLPPGLAATTGLTLPATGRIGAAT